MARSTFKVNSSIMHKRFVKGIVPYTETFISCFCLESIFALYVLKIVCVLFWPVLACYVQNCYKSSRNFFVINLYGKINWISNINETTYQKFKGTDVSYRPYFTIPKDTYTVYYSSLIQSNDKVPRLYIL